MYTNKSCWRSLIASEKSFTLSMINPFPFRLAPGQSRPLCFRLSISNAAASTLSFRLLYNVHGSPAVFSSPVLCYTLTQQTTTSPHKFTYLLPSGIVSYAILRPPSIDSLSESSSRPVLPVLVNLHGAGLEADSHQVRHMLDAVPDLKAWVIFPTGVTPWSGDDWRMLHQELAEGASVD